MNKSNNPHGFIDFPITPQLIEFDINTKIASTNIYADGGNRPYQFLIIVQNYYAGLYDCDNLKFKEILVDFLKNLWVKGQLFIIFEDDRFLYYTINKKIWKNGRIYKVYVSDIHDNKNNPKQYTFENIKDGYFILWSSVEYSGLYLWWQSFKNLASIEKSFIYSAKQDKKRFIKYINHNNKTINDLENEYFEDENKNIYPIYAKSLENNEFLDPNIYKEITYKSITSELYNNLNNYYNWTCNINGKRINNIMRESGKTEVETQNDNYHTYITEQLTLHNLNLMGQYFKDKYNEEIKFNIRKEKVNNDDKYED